MVVGPLFTARGTSAYKKIEVILDSGADVSLIPLWLGSEGVPDLQQAGGGIQDARGKKIPQAGRRAINLTMFRAVEVRESFIVASIVNPLLAIGKLFRDGWQLTNEDNQLYLNDGTTRVPVHYHKNSLAATAYIQTCNDSRKPDVRVRRATVRTVIEPNSNLAGPAGMRRPSWRNTDSLVLVRYAPAQSTFVDPTPVFSTEKFPYRSTMIQHEDGSWTVVEARREYGAMEDPFENINEGGEHEVIATLSTKTISLWILGVPKNKQAIQQEEERSQDSWGITKEGTELVRYHVTLRTMKFNPEGASGCPLGIESLTD